MTSPRRREESFRNNFERRPVDCLEDWFNKQAIDQEYVAVGLEPGLGGKLDFKLRRYANQPTLAEPWRRAEGRIRRASLHRE